MDYKGKFILDDVFNYKSIVLNQFGNDGVRYWSASKENLKAMLKIIEDKEADLKANNIEYGEVYVSFSATEESDYDDAHFTVDLEWSEKETPEEKENRIKVAKKRIDEALERENESKKNLENKMVAAEIAHLEKLGYKVSK